MPLNEAGNPYRSPCCPECGDCVSVFSIDTGGSVPAMDGDWTTCTTNALADWVTPSHTAKKKCGSDNGYYATAVQTPFTNCRWQAAQYCIDHPDGYRGRSWVVDVYFKDDADSVTTLTDVVQDWRCTCKGPRFDWTLSGTIPDCMTAPVVDPDCPCLSDPPPDCLRVTIPAFTLHNTVYGNCSYAGGTYDLTYTPAFGCYFEHVSADAIIGLIYNPSGFPATCAGDASLKWTVQATLKSICSSTPNCTLNFCSSTCTGTYTYGSSCYELGSGQTGGPPSSVTVATCP